MLDKFALWSPSIIASYSSLFKLIGYIIGLHSTSSQCVVGVLHTAAAIASDRQMLETVGVNGDPTTNY